VGYSALAVSSGTIPHQKDYRRTAPSGEDNNSPYKIMQKKQSIAIHIHKKIL